MDTTLFTKTLPLTAFHVTDDFWLREMELVRTEVLPYQWNALNDRIPDAAPSFCMHNFRAAARLNARRRAEADAFVPPCHKNPKFETLPDVPGQPEPDRFYGFLFQDTDFSKWIEAVGYSLVLHPDADLEKTADEAIDVVCEAQMPDGYLDTYYILNDERLRATNLRNNHELYCLGHLIEGAVSYYQATGKDKLLKAACRFADWADATLGTEGGKKRGYPGHEIAEMALFRLYEVTNEDRYLRLANYFLNERGQEPNYFYLEECALRKANDEPAPSDDPAQYAYYQAHKPVRKQDEALGHSVRAMYLYSGMADAARLSNDDAMAEACERLFKSTVEQKMYITGGVGSTYMGEAFTYPYDLPNDSAYSETCASIGLVFFARRMLQIHPDSRYADAMERALYNTVLAGMAIDGKSFFYVNPLEVVPEACHRDERLKHVKPIRQKWFGCACCPPNISRLVSSLPTYAYTVNDTGIYTHLYIGGTVNTTLNGKPIVLDVVSGFPWNGHVEIKINAEKVNGTICCRIPGWCKDFTCISDKETSEKDGYIYLNGIWNTGDSIILDFPMEPKLIQASANVREDYGKLAVTCGPIIYCGESADNGNNIHLINIDPKDACHQMKMRPDNSFPMQSCRIDLPAYRRQNDSMALYAEWNDNSYDPVQLSLIPYYLWNNRGENEMRVWFHTK